MWLPGFLRRSKTIDQIAEEIDASRAGGGISVNAREALQVSTVFACVDVIATGCAVPPLEIYRETTAGKKERAVNDPHYRLLHRRPNEWQTSLEFRDMLTAHAALVGDGIAIKTRDPRTGAISEMIPVPPQSVTIERRSRYAFTYLVQDEFGVVGRFSADQVFHLRNRSRDLVGGVDVVKLAAKSIGLAMASERNLSSLHENGGRPSGILSTDNALSNEAIERVKEQFAAVSRGQNAYKTALVDNGLTYQPLGMNQVDAQTLETRRMQVEEVCRMFGVFPQMVGHSDKTATYASAEAFFAAHNRTTVRTWQENWRQRLDEFVLDGSGPLFVGFDNRERQSAGLKDQAEYYARALGSGGGVPWMTQNEVRGEQGLDPIDGGDEVHMPIASTQQAQTGGEA